MTILQAITRADDLRSNSFSQEQKLAWLSEIEGRVQKEVLHTSDDLVLIYESNMPTDAELLVKAPYDSLYIDYLLCMYALYDEDLAQYNAYLVKYNETFANYLKTFCREQKSTPRHIYYGR